MSMNFLGIGSNMDMQSIVDYLIALERRPIIRFENQKKDYTSKQTIWREVNTRLSALSSSLDGVKLSSDFDKIKATSSDDKILTVTANVGAVFGEYEIEVIQLAKAQKVISNQCNEEIIEDVVLNINGKTVTVEASEADPQTIIDVARAINNTKDIGVNASVVDNYLVFETSATNTTMNFDGENSFLTTIGVLDESGQIVADKEIQAATGAIVNINGIEVKRDSNIIEEALLGVKITLKKESSDKVDITIDNDVDAIFNKIKGFIDEYKKVQEYLDTQTFFTKGTGDKPNSTGQLFGDSTVSVLKTRLRSAFTGAVDGIAEGNLRMLAQIGIDVDKTGNVKFDEAKLKEAIKEKPAQVAELFVKKDTGLTSRIQTYVKSYTEYAGIIDTKVQSYDNRIKDIEQSIQRLDERVEMRRQTLIRQFTALDKALSSNYDQSAWLSTQLQQLVSFKKS